MVIFNSFNVLEIYTELFKVEIEDIWDLFQIITKGRGGRHIDNSQLG